MSIYSEIKEIYKDTTQLSNKNHLADNIIKILKLLTFLSICFVFLLEECGLKESISNPIELSLNRFIFISINILVCVYLFYILLLKPLIKALLIYYSNGNNAFPIFFTVDDIIGIIFHVLFLLQAMNDILLCFKCNNVICEEGLFYAFVVIGALFRFINKLYIQNSNNWYYISRKYTDFFDRKGNRIAEDDEVIYKNKIYKIHQYEGEWCLQSYDSSPRIKLEVAVVDNEGKIEVCSYNKGKKGLKE